MSQSRNKVNAATQYISWNGNLSGVLNRIDMLDIRLWMNLQYPYADTLSVHSHVTTGQHVLVELSVAGVVRDAKRCVYGSISCESPLVTDWVISEEAGFPIIPTGARGHGWSPSKKQSDEYIKTQL